MTETRNNMTRISQTIVIAAVFAPLSAFAGDIDGGTDPLVQVSEGVNEPDASSSAATLFQNFHSAVCHSWLERSAGARCEDRMVTRRTATRRITHL